MNAARIPMPRPSSTASPTIASERVGLEAAMRAMILLTEAVRDAFRPPVDPPKQGIADTFTEAVHDASGRGARPTQGGGGDALAAGAPLRRLGGGARPRHALARHPRAALGDGRLDRGARGRDPLGAAPPCRRL